MFEADAFLIGMVIGLASSVVGATIDYRVRQRRDEEESGRTPGCIFIVPGALGLLGIVVVGISLFMQSVTRALIAGVGVLAGFFLGFIVMVVLWFIKQRGESS